MNNSVERFITELIENANVIRLLDDIYYDDFDISHKKTSMGNLYEKYTEWCALNNEKAYANNRFGAMIPKELIKDRGNNRINKKMVRWMEFN